MLDMKIAEAQANETVTKADLVRSIFLKIGLSRRESADLVEMVFAEIAESLTRHENVKLSSFGTFEVRHKMLRIGRNPKTGVEVPIKPRCVMVFKPSNVMKAKVNGLDAPAGDF